MIRRISILACLLCVALAAQVAQATTHSTTPTQGRTCFPAAQWSTTQAYRPCVRITRVYEDGSFSFSAQDADGTERYSARVGSPE